MIKIIHKESENHVFISLLLLDYRAKAKEKKIQIQFALPQKQIPI
jgi:hypothetical protein